MDTERVIWAWGDVTENRDGDEYRIFSCAVCYDDGEPMGKIYTSTSRERIVGLARRMARDRRLPLEIDIAP